MTLTTKKKKVKLADNPICFKNNYNNNMRNEIFFFLPESKWFLLFILIK